MEMLKSHDFRSLGGLFDSFTYVQCGSGLFSFYITYFCASESRNLTQRRRCGEYRPLHTRILAQPELLYRIRPFHRKIQFAIATI